MLQCPSSLKQMSFKMECFSSLLVTINTELIIFNIRLSMITNLNHEIQEQKMITEMPKKNLRRILIFLNT